MLDGVLKSLLSLWENLARNHRYANFVDERDISYVTNRVAREGLHFLTAALPELGRALDKYHATNTWYPPEGFKTKGWRSVFLRKAIEAALDGDSVAVDCVRQLSYLFYKLEVPHGKEADEAALQSFIRTDRDVTRFDFGPDHRGQNAVDSAGCQRSFTVGVLIERMRGLIARVLSNEDPLDIRPRHGGGATACRTPNHMKWHQLRYYSKLDQTYDYGSYFFFNPSHLVDEMEKLELSSHQEPRARVCLVPKDSRGPRVISCEPAELMYIQQGLMRRLYDIIENHRLTRGQINFSDQSVNRDLAWLGSKFGNLGTLDLKDASDRVSLELVRRVFPPNWLECLEACRSEETLLPSGEIVKLQKFAPMGSSCCFPVEALVFWACAVATVKLGGWKNQSPVYVYGDDIICDVALCGPIMAGLESIGLLVNRDKSFVSGPFRESCGGDYHNGYDVTPVRIRKVPTNVGTSLQASADLCNEFIAKFGFDSSQSFRDLIHSMVGYCFPVTPLRLPLTVFGVPRASNDVFFARRWNKDLQRWEHRILASISPLLKRQPPNWAELLRKELERGVREEVDPDNYQNESVKAHRVARAGEYVGDHPTRIKWRWSWLG